MQLKDKSQVGTRFSLELEADVAEKLDRLKGLGRKKSKSDVVEDAIHVLYGMCTLRAQSDKMTIEISKQLESLVTDGLEEYWIPMLEMKKSIKNPR